MTTRDRVCGRPTKKGTPCTRGLHYWMTEGFTFEYADGCWRHMSPHFREATEARKQADEEAWLTYLYADPICWGWPVPRDLDSWTPPQGDDVGNHLTDETLSMVMDDPETRASMLLRRWQDGRCAICGHRRSLVEDHDHSTGMVRGHLCGTCNVREGIYREGATLFGKYRERHPTKMLGLQIRYWDPLGKDAQATTWRAEADKWTDAASEDIGL